MSLYNREPTTSLRLQSNPITLLITLVLPYLTFMESGTGVMQGVPTPVVNDMMAVPQYPIGWRAFSYVAAVLCLVLLGRNIEASAFVVQDARPMLAWTVASHSDREAMACMPCARCYVAPVPLANPFNGEGSEPEGPVWWIHAVQWSDSVESVDTEGRRAQLPLRIVYCRWRN